MLLLLLSLATHRSSVLAHMHASTQARTHACTHTVSSACAACDPASLSRYTLFITSPLGPPRQLRGTSSSRSLQALLLLLTCEKAAPPPLRRSLFTCTAWQPAARSGLSLDVPPLQNRRDSNLTFSPFFLLFFVFIFAFKLKEIFFEDSRVETDPHPKSLYPSP